MPEIENGGSPDGGVGRVIERRRRHAHHCERAAVHVDGGFQNVRIASEHLLPEAVSEHRDGVLAGHILFPLKALPNSGSAPSKAKKVGGGSDDTHAGSLACAPEAHIR
ncbi:MAG: hypothetical protein ABSG65_15195 [Bryobacteraceae bacterium]|jgi:hypothetical protein